MARVTRAHMTSGDRWIDRKRRQLKLAAAAIKTAKTGVVSDLTAVISTCPSGQGNMKLIIIRWSPNLPPRT